MDEGKEVAVSQYILDPSSGTEQRNERSIIPKFSSLKVKCRKYATGRDNLVRFVSNEVEPLF